MKHYVIRGILFLGICLLLSNCEREELYTEPQGKATTERITLNEFQNRISDKNYTQIQKYFQRTTSDKTTRTESESDFIILTNSIVTSQNGDNTSYTFQVVKAEETTEDSFYNLVITINQEGEITKSDVYEYMPSVPYTSNTSAQYFGALRMFQNHNIHLNGLFENRSEDECLIDAIPYWECNYGYNHEPGSCMGTVFTYNLRLVYGSCTPDPALVNVDNSGGGNGDGNGVFDPTPGGGQGNDNPDPPNEDDVDTSPLNEPVDYSSEIINCINNNNVFGSPNFSLSQTQEEWINTSATNRELIDLWNFLDSGNCGQDAQEFALEAIDALEEGGEVDYEDRIIIDASIPDCVKDIIKKIKENDVQVRLESLPTIIVDEMGLTSDILEIFNNSDRYHINFLYEDIPTSASGAQVNATTIPRYDSTLGNIYFDIKLDPDYVASATDLSIARTIIHECIHAYISYIYQTEIFADLSESLRYLLETNDMPIAQHILMAQQFVENIADALEMWDNSSLGIDNEYYNYLSWSGGLQNTPAFNSLSPSYRQNCIDAVIAEQSNSSNALGQKNCN